MYYSEELCHKYLNSLQKELDSLNIQDIVSIYIGGGTPSSLSIENLKFLLDIVDKYVYDGISFTFEANVESLNEEKIILLQEYGVNRVSLGVQSFSSRLLKKMNRYHNEEDCKNVISLLHKHHIDDINIDLMYGLPEQNLQDFKQDVEKAVLLDITHISSYALSINPNTIFYNSSIKEKDEDLLRDEYDYLCLKLEENGFHRYEVSNFAKDGFESRHNKLYWMNKEYFGCGLGASSYLGNIRYDNTKSLNKYLKGDYILNKEILSDEDKIFYALMLGLRLEKGINIQEFNEEYHIDFEKKYQEKLNKLIKQKMIEFKEGYVKVTKENIYILDYIEKILLY